MNDDFIKDGLFLFITLGLCTNKLKTGAFPLSPDMVYAIRGLPPLNPPKEGGGTKEITLQRGGAPSLFSEMSRFITENAAMPYRSLGPGRFAEVVKAAGGYGPELEAAAQRAGAANPQVMATWAQEEYNKLLTEIRQSAGGGIGARLHPLQVAPLEDALIKYYDEASAQAMYDIRTNFAQYIAAPGAPPAAGQIDSEIDRPGGKGNTLETQLDQLMIESVKRLKDSLNFKKAELGAVTIDTGAVTAAMSAPFKTATNQILVAICKQLDEDYPSVPTGNDVYHAENLIIHGVAQNGSMASIDKTLFDAWKTGPADAANYWPNKYNGSLQPKLDPAALVGLLMRDQNNCVEINLINNAMNQDLVTVLSQSPNVKILCHISSLIDAQGRFGSCFKGDSSPGFVNGDIDITLYAGSGSAAAPLDYCEFGLQQNVNKKKVVIQYYLQSPQTGPFQQDPVTGLTRASQPGSVNSGSIVEIIDKSAIMTLSASNTFASVLNRIEQAALNVSGQGKSISNIIENSDFIKSVADALANKYVGDLNQELGTVASNGGFTSKTEGSAQGKAVYSGGGIQHGGGRVDPCVVMANGDRPSTVRASCILEGGEGDINPNSQILYTTLYEGPQTHASQVYLTSKYSYAGAAAAPRAPAIAVGGSKAKTIRRKRAIPKLKLTLRKKKQKKKHKTRGKKQKPNIKSKIRKNRTVSKRRRSRKKQ
jgi:hypothetical protein